MAAYPDIRLSAKENFTGKNVSTNSRVHIDYLEHLVIKPPTMYSNYHRAFVPEMYVYEFQPEMIYETLQQYKFAAQRVKQITSLSGFKDTIQTLAEGLFSLTSGVVPFVKGEPVDLNNLTGELAQQALKQDIFNNDPGDSLTTDLINSVNVLYEPFFTGSYYGAYTLPYYATEDATYSVDGGEGWSSIDSVSLPDMVSTKRLNSIIQSVQKLLPNTVAPVPTWNANNSTHGSNRTTFSTKFSLYNRDLESLSKNLNFIHTIVPSVMYIQTGYRQYAPCIFTVIIPGYNAMLFSVLEVTVTPEGSRRFLKPASQIYLQQNSFNNRQYNVTDRAVFPDIYNVKLEFRSLTPSNFNMYLYYMFGNYSGRVGAKDYTLTGADAAASLAAKGEGSTHFIIPGK